MKRPTLPPQDFRALAGRAVDEAARFLSELETRSSKLKEQERVIGRQKGSGAPNGYSDEFAPVDFSIKDADGNPLVDVDAPSDEKRSTPHQPWLKHERALKLKPGEIAPVEIEIWPSSTMFRAGETLQLEIQGGSFTYTRSNPLPLRHGRICTGHDETVNAGTHTIHCGDKYYSHLLVPVIPQS